MGKEICIFKDKAGNKLCQKYIKTRKIWQMYAKNKEGRLVDISSFKSIARRAKLKLRKVR